MQPALSVKRSSIVCALMLAGCGRSGPHDDPPARVEPKHEDRHDPAAKPTALQIDVIVDGAKVTWSKDAFDQVPHMVGSNNDGEARDVWSVRELARRLVGPAARVVAITGSNGTKTIDPASWADPTRIPILHTTRRGNLKFRWADPDGKWGETEIKDVSKLEISAAPPPTSPRAR